MNVWACHRCAMPIEPRVDHGRRRECSQANGRCVPREIALAEATAAILGKLQMLADGPTQNLDPNRVTGSPTKSKPPTRSGGSSLFDFYRSEFERCADDSELESLWMVACDDYEDFRFKADHRIEVRRGEKVENDPADPGAAERAQAKRICEWYEGKPALYVAMIESRMGGLVTELWVRKARKENGRDPDDGRPLPEFLDLDDEERRRKVRSLAMLGLGKKAAAKRLGVNPDTVRRYWPEKTREPVAA